MGGGETLPENDWDTDDQNKSSAPETFSETRRDSKVEDGSATPGGTWSDPKAQEGPSTFGSLGATSSGPKVADRTSIPKSLGKSSQNSKAQDETSTFKLHGGIEVDPAKLPDQSTVDLEEGSDNQKPTPPASPGVPVSSTPTTSSISSTPPVSSAPPFLPGPSTASVPPALAIPPVSPALSTRSAKVGLPINSMSDAVENSGGDDKKRPDALNTNEISLAGTLMKVRQLIKRDSFSGSIIYNFMSFVLPALHTTLSPLLIGHPDTKQISTTNVFKYLGAISMVLNDGLPRIAWTVIGDHSNRKDHSRISLSNTLILFQVVCGIAVSGIFMASAGAATRDAPADVRRATLAYVRITSISTLSSAIEVSISNCTRALDKPEVPLLINTIKFFINIILDISIMSQFTTGLQKPSLVNQAIVRMVCDLVSALCGLAYYVMVTAKTPRRIIAAACRAEAKGPDPTGPKLTKLEVKNARKDELEGAKLRSRPCLASLMILLKHGIWTLSESAIRNMVLLWLFAGLVPSMDSEHIMAREIFLLIRFSLVMVPLQTLEASTLTFIGHEWGRWTLQHVHKSDCAESKPKKPRPTVPREELLEIVQKAKVPLFAAPVVDIPFYVIFSIWVARPFGQYMSGSEGVAGLVRYMWRTVDWCYILTSFSTILGAVLLATTPRYYCLQGLIPSVLLMMTAAIAVPGLKLSSEKAWTYTNGIMAGERAFAFISTLSVVWLWRFWLVRGKVGLLPIKPEGASNV